jgi:hypothetical protein
MKQRILTVFAALASLWLLVELSPPPLQNTKLAWINWDFLTGRNSFYFKKRQWLADARTIVAVVHYLYESRTSGQINPIDVANVPHSPPRPGISTNLLGINGAGSSSPLARIRLSRAKRIIGHAWLSCLNRLPPEFASAEFPSNVLSGLPLSDLEARCYVPQVGKSLLQRLPHRAHGTPPGLRNPRPDPGPANLQGA